MSQSGIKAFMHCAACVQDRRRARIAVGLVDPVTIRIWCNNCNKLVTEFILAEPEEVRCDHCGLPIDDNHRHH